MFLWVNVLTAKQTVIQYCEYLHRQNQREKSKYYNNFYMLFANRNKNIENISKRTDVIEVVVDPGLEQLKESGGLW